MKVIYFPFNVCISRGVSPLDLPFFLTLAPSCAPSAVSALSSSSLCRPSFRPRGRCSPPVRPASSVVVLSSAVPLRCFGGTRMGSCVWRLQGWSNNELKRSLRLLVWAQSWPLHAMPKAPTFPLGMFFDTHRGVSAALQFYRRQCGSTFCMRLGSG